MASAAVSVAADDVAHLGGTDVGGAAHGVEVAGLELVVGVEEADELGVDRARPSLRASCSVSRWT
jgi:hypothetical protein